MNIHIGYEKSLEQDVPRIQDIIINCVQKYLFELATKDVLSCIEETIIYNLKAKYEITAKAYMDYVYVTVKTKGYCGHINISTIKDFINLCKAHI